MRETIFLLIDGDDKAVACIQSEKETACLQCSPEDKGYCPSVDYTGDPKNPCKGFVERFEVRRAECRGAF